MERRWLGTGAGGGGWRKRAWNCLLRVAQLATRYLLTEKPRRLALGWQARAGAGEGGVLETEDRTILPPPHLPHLLPTTLNLDRECGRARAGAGKLQLTLRGPRDAGLMQLAGASSPASVYSLVAQHPHPTPGETASHGEEIFRNV